MALGTFTLKAKGKAGSYDPRNHVGKPLIVVPREFRPNFTTQRFPNPKDVVIVDVVDLAADTVHVSVIWGGGAMVDAIKDHVPADGAEPTKLPVKIQTANSAAGNAYYVLVPLEGQELQFAAAWDAKFPTRVDDERAQNAAAQAAAPQNPALPGLQGMPQMTQTQPVTQPSPADAIAALQAQLAALQGQATASQAPAAAPVQPQQPAMSDADLEAAIRALG